MERPDKNRITKSRLDDLAIRFAQIEGGVWLEMIE